jgi:transcriptional regulator with XRE-family HTH domain
MHESFGARLRRHREEQQIALVTIAEQTKIKLSLLEDLERDDVSHWPAGIFRRAFIRSYANALNLDPDTTVREFAEAHPSPVDVASAAAIAAAIEREGANGKTTSPFRTLMASLGFSRTPAPQEPVPVHQPAAHQPLRSSASVATEMPSRPATPARSFEPSEPLVDVSPMAMSAPRVLDEPIEPADGQNTDLAAEIAAAMAAERLEILQEPMRELASDHVLISDRTKEPIVKEPAPAGPDLMAFAQLCTEFGRVDRADEVPRLLREVARMMDASGLIVWVWDAVGKELRPAMTHGYSNRVVAQLPGVCREDDNATAAAFRSGQPCVIKGSPQSSAALVLPLMAPGGSAGVLAIELEQGRRLTKPIRAVATIFAALMAQLVCDTSGSDEMGMDHDVSIDHPLAAFNG